MAPFLVVLIAMECVGYAIDICGVGSPGFAFLALLLLFATGALWFAYWIRAAFFRGWRRAASRVLGPVAAVAAVASLSHLGWSPWRIAFELARPYYLYEVSRAAAGGEGIKRMSFLQFDKELWTGHAKREILYASDFISKPKDFRAPTELGGGCVWTTYVDLHSGFIMREQIASYEETCPADP